MSELINERSNDKLDGVVNGLNIVRVQTGCGSDHLSSAIQVLQSVGVVALPCRLSKLVTSIQSDRCVVNKARTKQ
eukprot:1336961-Amphidinium_carterae.1